MTAGVPGRTNTAVASGEARRVAIVAAATTLFAEQGHHATSLSQIGARAGVSKTAVAYHFTSKEAIVHAVLDAHQRRIGPVLMGIAEDRGLVALGRLWEIVAHDEHHREHAALWGMVVAEAASHDATLRPRVQENYGNFRAGIARFLREAREDGEVRDGIDDEAVATDILAVINGTTTSWLIDGNIQMVPIVQAHLQRVIADIRAD